MGAVGGSIEKISIRGRLFAVAADAEANRKLGGFENEVQPNGNGTVRKIMTRVPWLLDGLQVEIDDTRADLEYLQEIADSQELVSITITLANRATYQGTGTITGEIQASSQNTTATISLSGQGSLTQQ